jgi:DNA-binding NtrC family response regulator
MSAALPPVLVIDDEKNMRLSLQTMLEDEGYAARTVESAEQGLALVGREPFFMVITDAHLNGMSGYDLLGRLRQSHPELPVLMITAYATPKLAVEAIKAGAMDYLAKPFEPEELLHAVSRCAERFRLIQENARLRTQASQDFDVDQIIGTSPRMVELKNLIRTVAVSNATVLVIGESGVGKELVAGAIHGLSQRRFKAYIRINCAAIPENLLESELFGHEKGSFTGALRQKLGRVEEADGGTMFLDEIGDMSRPLQAKLLRFLEDGSFTRVGGNEELRVDVRLIAATNRDIIEAIRQNQFREDLFHRLNVVQLRPPPLRERGKDVLALGEHFLRQFNAAMGKQIRQIAAPAQQKLLSHHWPGNVRELRNVVERAVILETSEEIHPANLPEFHLETRLRKGELPVVPSGQSIDEVMASFEREFILNTLAQNRYNLTRTAEQLKISRHALRYRMQRLNIHTDAEEESSSVAGKENS